MIPLDDRGLLLGDGLFETVLARDGVFDALDAHLDRMDRGCAVLGLPPVDRVQAVAMMREALTPLGGGRSAVRLTLTAGSGGRGLDRPDPPQPRLFATAAPAPRADQPVRVQIVTIPRNETSPASRLKTLAYLDNVLARAEAKAAGADEALMLNGRGEVAGAAAANLFWLSRGRLFTPSLDCGVLDGIARGRVLARATELGVEVREVRLPPNAMANAEAVFLTNSLIGLRPVVWRTPRTAPADLLAALGEAFRL